MARYYQMFETKEERTAWEKKEKDKNPKFKVCMRMTARELKEDMPFVDITNFKYVTIWSNE